MNALHIAVKDLQILFRDRGVLVQLLGLPLIFILVFSGAMQATLSSNRDTRIALAVVDLDSGPQATVLLEGIEAAGGIRVGIVERAVAEEGLDKGRLPRALFVPEGFSADLEAGNQVTLRLVSRPDANPSSTEAIRLVIEGVARDMALEEQILTGLRQMGEMMANVPDAYAALAVEGPGAGAVPVRALAHPPSGDSIRARSRACRRRRGTGYGCPVSCSGIYRALRLPDVTDNGALDL